MAEIHSVARAESTASVMTEAVALAISYTLFDWLVAGPFQLVTYNASNEMSAWVGSFFVGLPQAIFSGVLGWFAKKRGLGGFKTIAVATVLLCLVRVALHAKETLFAVTDVFMPELLVPTLVVPPLFAAGALASSHVVSEGSTVPVSMEGVRRSPSVVVCLLLAGCAVLTIYVLQPLQWLVMMGLGSIPVVLAPAAMCLVPLLVFFSLANYVSRKGWLLQGGALLVFLFVVTCHTARWH